MADRHVTFSENPEELIQQIPEVKEESNSEAKQEPNPDEKRKNQESLTDSPAVKKRRLNVIASSYCAICLETYRDPRLLPCGHSFCAVCIMPILTDGHCPICRKPHSHRYIANIPSNVALASLAEDVVSLNLTDNDDDEGPFQVFVKDLTGRTHTIRTSPNESVSQFKKKISSAMRTPSFDEETLRLLFVYYSKSND